MKKKERIGPVCGGIYNKCCKIVFGGTHSLPPWIIFGTLFGNAVKSAIGSNKLSQTAVCGDDQNEGEADGKDCGWEGVVSAAVYPFPSLNHHPGSTQICTSK